VALVVLVVLADALLRTLGEGAALVLGAAAARAAELARRADGGKVKSGRRSRQSRVPTPKSTATSSPRAIACSTSTPQVR
jgi:hypothetical protein